jgi:23S rRNA (uridine2552-2'-O)-methyltransferase
MTKREDSFYFKARREGYRSRAAFKLIELNKKFEILSRAHNILEIGSSPGGWTDVLLERNPEFLLCVDLDANKSTEFPYSLRGDVTKEISWIDIENFLGDRKMDLILSDAMAHTSGQHFRDHAQSVEICTSILNYGKKVLREGGNIMVKQFQGEYTKEFMDTFKTEFRRNYITKPQASRNESSEIYILFAGLLPQI